MIRLKLKRELLLIIFTLLLIPGLMSPTQGLEYEDMIFATTSDNDASILEAEAVVDGDGNLHTFMHVQNRDTNNLIHLYYIDGEAYYNVLIEGAQGAMIEYAYTSPTEIGIVYSLDTISGTRIFYHYLWAESYNSTIQIFSLSASSVAWYVTYYQFLYLDDTLHAFHTIYHGDSNQFMNVTHYAGKYTFSSQSYEVNIPSSKPIYTVRQIEDIIIDFDDNIWYIYKYTDPTYGMGVSLLENNTITHFLTHDFNTVLFPIFDIKVQRSADANFSYIFANPLELHYGDFNSISISEDTQSVSLENPQHLTYYEDNDDKTLLVADLGEGNYVNFYQYVFNGIQWDVTSIEQENQVIENDYSLFQTELDFVILFFTNVSTDILEQPEKPLRYRDKLAMSVFILTSDPFDVVTVIEDLNIYNPIQEFLRERWYVLVIAGAGVILAGLIFGFFFFRRREIIKKFLVDKEVGDYPKFILFFLNIGRLFRNIFGTIFTIWSSNKKRTLLTLASFIITGYLLSSAVIIAQSEESAMIKAYDNAFPLFDDHEITAQLETELISNNASTGISSSYGDHAEEEILDLYENKAISKYVSGLDAAYTTQVKAYVPSDPSLKINRYNFRSLPESSIDFIESLLFEGRAPQNENEVVLVNRLALRTDVDINESLLLVSSYGLDYPSGLSDYLMNVTVVGKFARISSAQARRIAEDLGVPFDIYTIASENADILTLNSQFFDIISKPEKTNLYLRGYYQLRMNFDEFTIAERTQLITEQEEIQGLVFTLSFDSASSVTMEEELVLFFIAFNEYYLNNMARLLIFAVPAILLSIFMVFESSDLFSNSYESEIKILRNRGVSTNKLFTIYFSIRILEIIIASLVSFGIATLTAIPLIKINGFISFTNTDTHLVIGTVPRVLSMVAGVLIVITLPKILVLVRKRQDIEKGPSFIQRIRFTRSDPTKVITPSEQDKGAEVAQQSVHQRISIGRSILSFLIKSKLLSWRDIFFLALGGGLFYFFFNQAFAAFDSGAVNDFTLYLFLTIAGAIFTLIGGLPFAVKLLGLILRGLSVAIWRIRKSRFSFSMAEIGKDIKYFENITLIFLLVVLILVPVLIVPYSKEITLTEQAYFTNGTDVRIRDWDEVDSLTVDDFQYEPQVQSWTHVDVYTIYFGLFDRTKIVVVNRTSFLKTVERPPELASNIDWNQITLLRNASMIVSEPFLSNFNYHIGSVIEFPHPIIYSLRHSLEIIGSFDKFPIYYFNYELQHDENMIIMSTEAWAELEDIITRRLKRVDEMLIKTYQNRDTSRMVEKLSEVEQGLRLTTLDDVKDKLKTPLYNIFVIELLLSLFVATIVLIFSTFTTSIKILEKRVIKHDIMKKMGVNTTRIINMSTFQTMLAAIIPALAIGAAVGFLIIKPTLKQLKYGGAPYQFYVNYPILYIGLLFAGIPVLIYFSLTYFLRKEFAKYAPTMME